jgi:hypothetical protein
MASSGKGKLTKEQREEILRRVLAGESASALAVEFGCTRANVSLIKVTALYPERFHKQAEQKLTKRLTAEQKELFLKTLAETEPGDHFSRRKEKDLPYYWDVDTALRLTEKLFNKRPGKRWLESLLPKRRKGPSNHYPFGPEAPLPPKPFDIRNVPPELASDKSYIAYLKSPVYARIQQREYELAYAHWESLQKPAARSRKKAQEPPAPPVEDLELPPPGKRVGKHAKSKGSPFPKPKRRKR